MKYSFLRLSRVIAFCIIAAIFVPFPTQIRADDIPYVSQEDTRIALEIDGRVFSRLLTDEMARDGWSTVQQTLSMISYYRPITEELAKIYDVPAADPKTPEYFQTVTGYYSVRPIRTVCITFECSISFEGKHHSERLKTVNIPESVKKLTKVAAKKMDRSSPLWISFLE